MTLAEFMDQIGARPDGGRKWRFPCCTATWASGQLEPIITSESRHSGDWYNASIRWLDDCGVPLSRWSPINDPMARAVQAGLKEWATVYLRSKP